ncbi:MAG TPA: cyclic nucleotide-binding domain-containing protein, partial [Mucilaginibacter sp.]|nr:cyclic nucleotide-binding domain-containing protein [Mucilaginibacter sp.]
MDLKPLLTILNSVNLLNRDIQKRLAEIVVEEHFAKRTLLLKEGLVAHRVYFIKKGFVRAYYIRNNQQFTSWFMGEGDIIISVYSFLSRKPSFENIEVLDDCIVQSLNWDQLQTLYKDFVEFNITGRIITEQYYIKSEERAITLQTLPAKARYEKLLKEYPKITQY